MSKEAIKQMMEGNASGMQETLNSLLSQKASQKLEERKQVIGQSYFGKK